MLQAGLWSGKSCLYQLECNQPTHFQLLMSTFELCVLSQLGMLVAAARLPKSLLSVAPCAAPRPKIVSPMSSSLDHDSLQASP